MSNGKQQTPFKSQARVKGPVQSNNGRNSIWAYDDIIITPLSYHPIFKKSHTYIRLFRQQPPPDKLHIFRIPTHQPTPLIRIPNRLIQHLCPIL